MIVLQRVGRRERVAIFTGTNQACRAKIAETLSPHSNAATLIAPDKWRVQLNLVTSNLHGEFDVAIIPEAPLREP